MKPYVPGRSIESVRAELGIHRFVKLNQNENPLGPSPRALTAIERALRDVSLYPDGTVPLLRARLAAFWDLPADWLLVGNGSDEIFRLLAEVYIEPDDAVVLPTPSFAGYALVAQLMGARVVSVPLAGDTMDLPAMAEAATRERAPLVFLCRPNNPTGGVFAADALQRFLAGVPAETLVVLDEAYREFDAGEFDTPALLDAWPNLVVTRTFSKLYGLAGLRLGYGVMRPEVMAPLLRARDPFSVNTLAVAAGIAALDDREHIDHTLRLVAEGKGFLYDLFGRLGLTFVPTEANFVLVHLPAQGAAISDALQRRGVLVRSCASFGLPNSIRVTIGAREENEVFAVALEQVLAATAPSPVAGQTAEPPLPAPPR
jgi:histidinol-phosphate aminotransferase